MISPVVKDDGFDVLRVIIELLKFIQGTYPFGDVKSALPSVDFSHQEATLYIPEEDTEFDNVYFKCCGHRFKMEFSDWSVRIIQ